MAIHNLKKFAQPYTAQPSELTSVLFPTATTAQLADIGDPINTQDKYAGKWVLNTTTSLMVYAIGATAASAWHASTDGLADHSPV
jgi:hypothetical protein